jgi:hypothetical protein
MHPYTCGTLKTLLNALMPCDNCVLFLACYDSATIENKQKMLGLIFPERLMFLENDFQTVVPNEIITVLCNADKDSKVIKKKRAAKMLLNPLR